MDVMPKWAEVILVPLISLLLAAILSALVILAIGEDPVADAERFYVSTQGVVLVTPEMLGQVRHYVR